ncbi:unnamed protein product [marine sediment metagenome]|uniref:Mutator family transposase n=1 Tax=marine sediment metagenome TaxID=412755 RepID=X1QXR4_9ZZZZ
MNNPLGLSKTKLNEIFSDVNILYRDNIEEVIKEYVLQGLKRTFEKAMKAEVLGYLKAKRYERKKVRIDFRNGYRHRNLLTAFGLLQGLKVPRTRRKGGYCPGVFERYKRRWRQVNDFIREIFIAGASTRQVGLVMEVLLGKRDNGGSPD